MVHTAILTTIHILSAITPETQQTQPLHCIHAKQISVAPRKQSQLPVYVLNTPSVAVMIVATLPFWMN
jgi:hypothetical protein